MTASSTMDLFGFTPEKARALKLAVLFSAESDEWPTDQAVVDDLAVRFGPFTLDVAADADNAKAPRFFSLADNALLQNWTIAAEGGVAWCNPPYSACGGSSKKNDEHGFAEKAIAEVARGLAGVVMLMPARTCRLWFHRLLALADLDRKTMRGDAVVEVGIAAGVWCSLHFALGRLRFNDATTDAPFPSVVIVMRRA